MWMRAEYTDIFQTKIDTVFKSPYNEEETMEQILGIKDYKFIGETMLSAPYSEITLSILRN